MKKIVLFVFIFIIVLGTAFAEFPDGLGIGIALRAGAGHAEGGLALKFPTLPIFWYFTFNDWAMSIIGDYYFYGDAIDVDAEVGLDWYLGVGGEFWFNYDFKDLGLLVRVPIGLSFQPIKAVDIFLEAAPKIGLKFYDDTWHENGRKHGKSGVKPDFNIDIMLGVRLWPNYLEDKKK